MELATKAMSEVDCGRVIGLKVMEVKVMGRPSTVKETLGSCMVMICVGKEVPRPRQS